LRSEGLIADWHEGGIGAGKDRRAAIHEHLDRAAVVLLLVSPDFMASDDCHDIEAGRAPQRQRRGEAAVLPIILRPTDWTGAPFAHLEALPRKGRPVTQWKDRDKAWLDVVRGLRAAIAGIAAAR